MGFSIIIRYRFSHLTFNITIISTSSPFHRTQSLTNLPKMWDAMLNTIVFFLNSQ
ncbi:hypothetical protein HanXRQr2_Chr16g0766531 [Helianthus annuus]|uniref:Uncharacterized protein n=1 Tax=Helianthus annuus TaxID=4232 RepID=A0A9K3H1T8_HELAN|nr:hypothetical protein HanXRQr2_Chr16g0766531 [Helianthus annuus]